MADLFIKQAKQYAKSRPGYPQELFDFIVSKTPEKNLVWDVGTGSGQAAKSLANVFKQVIGTDTSAKQLELAPVIPNVRYHRTPPVMSMAELGQTVSGESSVDLVSVGQAMHWFDLPVFYKQVKWILKKPDGVIAAWCYNIPEVNELVDRVLIRFYKDMTDPFWAPARKLVEEKYTTIEFPFEPVEGVDGTGPFMFTGEMSVDLDGFLTYLRSWSAYQTAKDRGIELLTKEMVRDFECAWNEDGPAEKIVRFPVALKIGRVGN